MNDLEQDNKPHSFCDSLTELPFNKMMLKIDKAACHGGCDWCECTSFGVVPILMEGSRCSHAPSLRGLLRKCLVRGILEEALRRNLHI